MDISFKLICRWLEYDRVGKQVHGTRFIAFKVPLREVIQLFDCHCKFSIEDGFSQPNSMITQLHCQIFWYSTIFFLGIEQRMSSAWRQTVKCFHWFFSLNNECDFDFFFIFVKLFRLYPKLLLSLIPNLGLIIDLTATTKYYNPDVGIVFPLYSLYAFESMKLSWHYFWFGFIQDFIQLGVEYKKILVQGQVIPSYKCSVESV